MNISLYSTKTTYFQSPTKIIFGLNSISKLSSEAEKINTKRVFLVCDRVIVKLGHVDKLLKILDKVNITSKVFDEVEAEPSLSTAEVATEFVRKQPYDLVIGIGGGSVMDVAKIASFMAKNYGKIKDYIFTKACKKAGLPTILIPTTAGTGSEVSQVAMLTLDNKKISFSNPILFSNIAIVDPNLTISMPQMVTASTGIDALSHTVEAMMSSYSNYITDALSLEAIKLIKNNLKLAYSQGNNLEARCNMSWAALLGGMVLYAKLVYGHSFGYTLGPRYGFSHGLSCGLALPYVMDYNLQACVDKFISIAACMGENVEGLPKLNVAFKAVLAIKNLIKDLGLPTNLKEVGVPKEILPILADELVNDYPRQNNPRKITKEDVVKLYERAWEGKLGNNS